MRHSCVLFLLSGCSLLAPDRAVGDLPPGYETGETVDVGDSGDVCASDSQCQPGKVCFQKFCVGSGALRVSLWFDTDSDFDLHLVTPLGSEIFFGNPVADGGYLDVDQCVSPCGLGNHVENIFFENAVRGQFQVSVVNFDGRSAGNFGLVVVANGNQLQNFSGFLSPPAGSRSQNFSFAF